MAWAIFRRDGTRWDFVHMSAKTMATEALKQERARFNNGDRLLLVNTTRSIPTAKEFSVHEEIAFTEVIPG